MKRLKIWMTTICMVLFSGLVMAQTATLPLAVNIGEKTLAYKLSGPYSHNNLSVYLVQGSDQVSDKKMISLEAAIEKGLVRIDETGNVNNLSARNLSAEYHILIQSGDIVKGGKQDRTIGKDVILAPKSGKVPLDAFCVEHGRWQSRGNETVTHFSSAKKQLSSKELKLAAKQAKSQQEVWKAVEEEQARLSSKVGRSVKNEASASSLQLTLEDKAIQAKVSDYVEKLLPSGSGQADVVGIVYVINGAFNAVDIYATNALFKEVWNKSLEAAGCEAVSVFEASAVFTEPSLQTLVDHITMGVSAPVQEQKSGGNIRLISRDSKDSVVYETLDEKGRLIHFNVIHK